MKFPAYFDAGPYLAVLPQGVWPARMPRRKDDLSPEPEPTKIVGKLGREERDLSRLKEPIHQIFVNWPSDIHGITEFTRKYGLIDDYAVYGDNEFELEDGAFNFAVADWRSKQTKLRRLWDQSGMRDPQVLFELNLLVGLNSSRFRDDPDWLIAQQAVASGRVADSELLWIQKGGVPTLEIQARTLYRHMCFLVMFEKLGSLRHCENPECTSPRFRAGRKDQVFCSADCAQLIAKRRWWAEHGNEWRQKRKVMKKSKPKRGKL